MQHSHYQLISATHAAVYTPASASVRPILIINFLETRQSKAGLFSAGLRCATNAPMRYFAESEIIMIRDALDSY